MEKAGRHQIMGGGVGGGAGRKMGPTAAPAMGLQKQNSWSPDIERDEAWERRRRGMRRGGSALRRVRSVTDDDLDELRGCIDLGFGFEPPAAGSGCAACGGAGRSRLLETLPALDLYYAVHGGGGAGAEGCVCACGAASEVSSDESPLGSPMSILSPGDTPETVKMRLKQWAQVVALSMLSRH
ncbi:uncharacterized protein C2845_PM12G28070 [Panicum miliaceum]|uniref:Uncharacterized protein n=1 Tax=Panicum miliaceum TaxID=4540 RepID=A0A3L6QM90_PANMI|nr:uncharacterized protein C2845_PM12G28070 [Panicum miliaceum]